MTKSFNVDEYLYHNAALAMANEIDKQLINNLIIVDLIEKSGWTKTNLEMTFSDFSISDISAWIHINATGDYKLVDGYWFFEKAEDATAFTLRWA